MVSCLGVRGDFAFSVSVVVGAKAKLCLLSASGGRQLARLPWANSSAGLLDLAPYGRLDSLAEEPSTEWCERREGKILASYGKSTWLPLCVVLVLATAAGFVYLPWAGVLCALALCFVLLFFRDPERRAQAPGTALIAPADGRVVEIAEVEEPDHVGGKAGKIAIFMSVLDVHVNRAPCDGKVEWTRHEPGRFLNAFAPEASIENERTLVALRDAQERPVLLKLVAGLIARRIVCPLRPGDSLRRGERLGMIKFGSRVEVLLPDDGRFHVAVRLGERVRAGETVLGEWR